MCYRQLLEYLEYIGAKSIILNISSKFTQSVCLVLILWVRSCSYVDHICSTGVTHYNLDHKYNEFVSFSCYQ